MITTKYDWQWLSLVISWPNKPFIGIATATARETGTYLAYSSLLPSSGSIGISEFVIGNIGFAQDTNSSIMYLGY